MSTYSDSTTCPNCKAQVDYYEDSRPFPQMSVGTCVQCGFYTSTTVAYENLETINELRAEYNDNEELTLEDAEFLSPLTTLPEQEEF